MKSRPKVMIVDDESAVRETLADFLEDEGFEPISANSGEEGLALLACNETEVAVVDMRLPGMDGSQFIQESKQLRPHMKHLILTGSVEFSVSPSLRMAGVEEGMLFHKPVRDMSLLVDAILGLVEE